MNVAKMRMFRWIYNRMRKAIKRNKVIRKKVKVASSKDKLREEEFSWFRHV